MYIDVVAFAGRGHCPCRKERTNANMAEGIDNLVDLVVERLGEFSLCFLDLKKNKERK